MSSTGDTYHAAIADVSSVSVDRQQSVSYLD
jgi:hypothetical protein